MVEEKRKSLGRGLSALLGEDADALAPAVDKNRAGRALPIEYLAPGRYQPRRRMDDQSIKDLAQSIAAKGILQPILVRPIRPGPNTYEIIAGERRWRAAQIAGLHEVPVVVKELTDVEALEIALIENLQRQDLTPLEEAEGYKRLLEEFSHTQEQLAETVGKSRSHVANMMRLLALPDAVKDMLQSGDLTAGHARALLTAPDPTGLAREIVAKGLSVREAERLAQAAMKTAQGGANGAAKTAGQNTSKDADIRALERDLANRLGLKVEIRHHGRQGGALVIHYTMLEQLDDILQRLGRGGPANKAGVRPFPEPAPRPAQSLEPAKPPVEKISVALRPVSRG